MHCSPAVKAEESSWPQEHSIHHTRPQRLNPWSRALLCSVKGLLSGRRVQHAGQAGGPRPTGGVCHQGPWPERSQRITAPQPSTMAASERCPCTRLTARAWTAALTAAPPRFLSSSLSLTYQQATQKHRLAQAASKPSLVLTACS